MTTVTFTVPLYEPQRQKDGKWKPIRSRYSGGFERVEWPCSTSGACVVLCAVLNEELKRAAQESYARLLQERIPGYKPR